MLKNGNYKGEQMPDNNKKKIKIYSDGTWSREELRQMVTSLTETGSGMECAAIRTLRMCSKRVK